MSISTDETAVFGYEFRSYTARAHDGGDAGEARPRPLLETDVTGAIPEN